MMPFITALGIILFCLLLICIIINNLSFSRENAWLSKHGTRIMARVTDVKRRINLTHKAQGMTDYIVIAQWEDPGTQRVYTYESDGRPSYPKKYLPGSDISVLIDPTHPEHYHMELPKREY